MDDATIIEAFRSLENGKTGMIDADDLKQLLTSLGDKFSEEEADALVKDAGGGPSIDFEKFVKKMNAEASKDPDMED
jgi:Ca2+-binding EF-hand superfamily protein